MGLFSTGFDAKKFEKHEANLGRQLAEMSLDEREVTDQIQTIREKIRDAALRNDDVEVDSLCEEASSLENHAQAMKDSKFSVRESMMTMREQRFCGQHMKAMKGATKAIKAAQLPAQLGKKTLVDYTYLKETSQANSRAYRSMLKANRSVSANKIKEEELQKIGIKTAEQARREQEQLDAIMPTAPAANSRERAPAAS